LGEVPPNRGLFEPPSQPEKEKANHESHERNTPRVIHSECQTGAGFRQFLAFVFSYLQAGSGWKAELEGNFFSV
jgi:hypothetical protein